eukprot:538386-Amphidinium_carterae.1
MRTAYLSLDRPDLLERPKTLASYMWVRIGKYLIRAPCLVVVYRPQESPSHTTLVVDADFAGMADGRTTIYEWSDYQPLWSCTSMPEQLSDNRGLTGECVCARQSCTATPSAWAWGDKSTWRHTSCRE